MASWGSGQFLSTIILLAVLFGDCSGKQRLPKDLLSKEEMTHVMIQIHLLEAKMGRLSLRIDSAKKVYRHFEGELLRELKVDSAVFANSFDYYSKNPEVFTKIYNAVVDSLMEMESREKLMLDEEMKLAESDTLETVNQGDTLTVKKEVEVKLDGKDRKIQQFKKSDNNEMKE